VIKEELNNVIRQGTRHLRLTNDISPDMSFWWSRIKVIEFE